MPVKVFVGSSVEGLSVAYAVQQNLEHVAEITVWDQGIFYLSQSALDSLVQALQRFDFGIFIFTPEDVVIMRGNENRAVRDNVLFELGLFVGHLGKDRAFIVMPKNQTDFHLPTDLIGMTPGTYKADRTDENLQAATGAICHTINQQMLRLGSLSEPNYAPQVLESTTKSKTEPFDQDQKDKREGIDEKNKSSLSDQGWWNAFFSGHYDEAISLLEAELEHTEDKHNRLFLMSMIGHSKAKIDLQSGLEYLTKIKQENSEIAGCYITIAQIYNENGRLNEALSILDEGCAAVKKKDLVRVKKADFLDGAGKTDDALNLLNDIIAGSPEVESAYKTAATILVREDRRDEALQKYEVGLRALPKSEQLLYGYGQLLLDGSNHAATLAVFTQLTQLNDKEPLYFGYLGNAYLSLDLNGLAMEAYRRANELAEGKQEWIIGNIGNLFNNQGLYPLAIENLKNATAMNSNSAYAHERLAAALKKDSEERKKAAEIIRKYKEQLATLSLPGSKLPHSSEEQQSD
jgi:predicted Zn-dependent protease